MLRRYSDVPEPIFSGLNDSAISYGLTGGPPRVSSKSPLTESAASRIISAESRCRGPRASQLFAGSFTIVFPSTRLRC